MSIRRQVLLPVLVLIPVGIGVGLGWARGGGDGAWDLALEPGESWTLERTDAPVLAAALSAEKVAVVPPDRNRVILLGREGRDEVAGFGASEISGLAADPEDVWIGAGRSLYRIGEEDLEVREWHGFDGAGEILAMAHARGAGSCTGSSASPGSPRSTCAGKRIRSRSAGSSWPPRT